MLLLIVRIVWWMEWIVAIIAIAAIIIFPFVRGSKVSNPPAAYSTISFNTPVTFSTATAQNVAATIAGMPAGQLKATEGNLAVQVKAGLLNTSLMVIVVLAAFACFILITYQLKLIFSSFEKSEPFFESNTRRIRIIGFVLIIYSLAQLAYNIAMNQYLLSHFKWDQGTQLTYSFNFGTLFTGLTLIVVAEVFKLGASLDNEQKLTI